MIGPLKNKQHSYGYLFQRATVGSGWKKRNAKLVRALAMGAIFFYLTDAAAAQPSNFEIFPAALKYFELFKLLGAYLLLPVAFGSLLGRGVVSEQKGRSTGAPSQQP